MNKQQQMDNLAQEIIKNKVGDVLAKTATQLVMGDGNLDAKIMFIGEAPGKKEDEFGKPFVGASGRFLNEMLASVNLKREDVYITNIVKYRPPENRDPSKAEKAEFAPYLLKQIKIIKPAVIVTLGRHSLSFFDNELQISEVHGQPTQIKFEGYDMTLLPLYHPAAALYNGGMRKTLLEDFQKVKDLM